MPKTTAQLEKLISGSGDRLTTVVLEVTQLLKSPEEANAAITKAVALAEKKIKSKQDVLIMTSRDLVVGDDEAKSLDIGSTVAKALVSFLEKLEVRPRYLIAKVCLY